MIKKDKDGPDDQTVSPDDASRKRVTEVVSALVVVLGLGLGLKAWDDRQRSDSAIMAQLQTEAALVSEQINVKIAAARASLALAQATGVSHRRTADAADGVDVVLRLENALQSPEGSRLGDAAEMAKALMESGQTSGLSASGDIISLLDAGDANPLIAIAPASRWISTPAPGRRIALRGATEVAAGSESLAGAPVRNSTGSGVTRSGMTLYDQACARSPQSALTVCSVSSRPLLSVGDLVSLLIYLLLFAAPVLAIFGLTNRITKTPGGLDMEPDDGLFPPQRQLDSVAQGADIGHWEMHSGFSLLELSGKTQELMGLRNMPSVTGADFLSAVAAHDRDRVQASLAEASASGWLQIRFKINDSNHDRWVELRGGLADAADDDGTGVGLAAFAGIAFDVSEQVRTEARIRAAERRLRSAIETFTEPFALWDRRQRLVFWNEAYARTFELSEILRPGISEDTVSAARAGAISREILSHEDSSTTVFALQSGRYVKMVDRPTETGGKISVGFDVSEVLKSEQMLSQQKKKLKVLVSELERSEGRAAELARKYSEEKGRAEYASKTKSAFLANMSHELRTPLNAVNGFSEIIANELFGPVGDARYKEYAADILASGQHLLDMINEILDMAKIEAGKMSIDPRPIDPVEPVDAAIRMIRRKAEDKSIELRLEHPDDLPDISADHRAMRQMVLNLVSNAVKFTPEHGRITVTVKLVEGYIEVGVRDTGVGIPKEDLPRLGQPFEQVKDVKDMNSEGTGLGLALTKSFAEMHGGRLTIDSKVGEGTLIRFYLPLDGPTSIVSRDMSIEARPAAPAMKSPASSMQPPAEPPSA